MQLIDRTDAQRLGMKRYFTGRPCKHGHIAERQTSTGHCFKCRPRWHRDFRNRDLAAARKKERDQRKRYDEATGRHRDLIRRRHAQNNGYLPPPPEKDYPRPDDGKCECCEKYIGRQGLVMDHDHHTGAFRGWTCRLCNVGLGALGDSMVGVRRAVQYMAKFYLTGRSRRDIHATKSNKAMAESPCS